MMLGYINKPEFPSQLAKVFKPLEQTSALALFSIVSHPSAISVQNRVHNQDQCRQSDPGPVCKGSVRE